MGLYMDGRIVHGFLVRWQWIGFLLVRGGWVVHI